jgi:alkylation response protein AidB-like acyl-CoA dehydrogenase
MTTRCSADACVLAVRSEMIYTIFEGTSEIQRLVIARMISGLHIP